MAQADVRPVHEPRAVRGRPEPLRQAGQRRAAPQRHRQPGPAERRSGNCWAARWSPRSTSSRPTATRTSASRPAPPASPPRASWRRSPSRRRRRCRTYYDKYKDLLPDPARDTPGFKVPRQIRVEILSIDGNALVRGIKDKLTESELRSYYENRKSEFKQPSEFPDEIFAGRPRADAPQGPALRRGPALSGHLARRREGAGRDRQQVRDDQG